MNKEKLHIGQPESFYAPITIVGGSKGIVIPKKVLDSMNWDVGMRLKLWAKKVNEDGK